MFELLAENRAPNQNRHSDFGRHARLQAALPQPYISSRTAAEDERRELLEPVDRVEVTLLRAVLDDDEKVQVGVLVQPLEVTPDRPQPEQRDRVTTLREHDTEVVEPLQEPLRNLVGQSGSQPGP